MVPRRTASQRADVFYLSIYLPLSLSLSLWVGGSVGRSVCLVWSGLVCLSVFCIYLISILHISSPLFFQECLTKRTTKRIKILRDFTKSWDPPARRPPLTSQIPPLCHSIHLPIHRSSDSPLDSLHPNTSILRRLQALAAHPSHQPFGSELGRRADHSHRLDRLGRGAGRDHLKERFFCSW